MGSNDDLSINLSPLLSRQKSDYSKPTEYEIREILRINNDKKEKFQKVFDVAQQAFRDNDQYKTNLAKSNGHKICRIPYWLSEEDERKEIQNILKGQPTYPDVPDLEQAKTKPLPK